MPLSSLQLSDYMEGSGHHWSCCGQPVDDTDHDAQLTSHADTGCETGRHQWRPHKKADRGKKDGPADLNWDFHDLPKGAGGKVKRMQYMY